MYKSETNEDYSIWEALATDSVLRKNLVKQCYNSFIVIQEGFGYFNCSHEEDLLASLNGEKKPYWQKQDVYEEYECTPVKHWELKKSEHSFDPSLNSVNQSTDVEVAGQYSADLDLFYTPTDAEALFNIKRNIYQEICKLTAEMLTVKDSDPDRFNELEGELTTHSVFNYLSEEEYVRKTLYYVCLFSNYENESSQQLLHEKKEDFHKLFN